MTAAGLLALAAGGAGLAAASLLGAAALRPTGLPSRLLALWLLAYGQVVLLAEVLSELRLLGRGGFLAGQAVFVGLAAYAWSRAGRPRPLAFAGEAARAALSGARRHRALALFALGVGVLALANLGFPFLYPPLNGDANAYHLPRAFYWLELGTARHFPTSDFRMTQMPPDPSFVLAWVLALSGAFQGLNVPQWLAALALACAVAGLSRLAGFARSASLFPALVVLCLPAVVVQTGSAQTELVTAAVASAAVLFGFRAILSERPARADLFLFGTASGLALGTKLTVLFLVPGLALAMAALAAARPRGERLAPVRALLLSGAVGFLALGAYNAVLNLLDFGNPVASRQAVALTSAELPPWRFDQGTNVVRYLYQALDWPGLSRSEDSPLPRAGRAAFEAVAHAIGLDLRLDTDAAVLASSRSVPDEDRSGFGPIGFLVLVAAPFAAVAALLRLRRERTRISLARAALLVASLAWLPCFLAVDQPWSAQRVRYFLVFLPIVAAATVPAVAGGSRLRRALAAGTGALSLVVATGVTLAGPGGIRGGAYREPGFEARLREEVVTALARDLPAWFPGGSVFGVVSEHNDTLFHLFRALPQFRFRPVSEEEIGPLLAKGEIAAALVGQFRRESGQGITRPAVPLPRNAVLTADPARFYREHPRQYRLVVREGDAGLAAFLPLSRPLSWTATGPLELRLPAGLVAAAGPHPALLLPVDPPPAPGEAFAASVDGAPAIALRIGADLGVDLSREAAAAGAGSSFVTLALTRRLAGGAEVRAVPEDASDGLAPLTRDGAWLLPRVPVAGSIPGDLIEGLWRNGELPILGEPLPFVRVEGFHGVEGDASAPFRWTDGKGVLEVPVSVADPPRAVRLVFVGWRDDARFRLEANGTSLLEATLPSGALARDVELPPGLGPVLRLTLSSDLFRPPGDARALGVCVRSVTLLRDRRPPGRGSGALRTR